MVNIQGSLFGKMLLEHIAATTETTFEPCLKKSDRPKFQCLNLEDGQPAEWSEFRSVTSRGEHLTLNIGESPNAAVESSLSQILQPREDVPQKYYLSSKACQGILRRAESRGKKLPPMLEQALKAQASSIANDQGGSVMDVSDKSATLRAQSHGHEPIVCAIGIDQQGGKGQANYAIEKCPTLAAESHGTPHAVAIGYIKHNIIGSMSKTIKQIHKGVRGDTSESSVKEQNSSDGARTGSKRPIRVIPTFDTTRPDPSKNQGGIAIFDMTHADEVMRPMRNDKVNTLNSRMGTGGNQVPVLQDKEIRRVRRLTPTECERLQGLPDGWTNVEFKGKSASDARRYKAIGNGMAQPCADFVLKQIVKFQRVR